MKTPRNTDTFYYYNANPKGKITTDCVIRALCTAMRKDYELTLKELVDLSIKTGLHIADAKLYKRYLKLNGWILHKQPKKSDGTKYTGSEFVKTCNYNERYIAHIGCHHIVAIVKCRVNDIWNSSSKCIGSYWTKEN